MISIKTKKIDERIAENYTKIKMDGIGEVYIGNELIFKTKNKWTRYFMSSIVVCIADLKCHYSVCSNSTNVLYDACGLSRYFTARIGINTTIPTNPDMSDLVNKVDVAPDSITRRAIKEPDYTLYIAEFVFIWNAGTLPDIYEGAPGDGSIDGKVGEFGVYLYTDNDDWVSGILNPQRCDCGITGRASPLYNPALRLASRIASADDAFDAFEFYGSIDPLTFKWRFQVAIV